MKRRQILAGGGALALAGAGAAYAGLRRMGSMEEHDASVAAMRATLSQRPEIPDFIRFATLAPNGHNTQPWRFRIGKDSIEILPDFSRRTPVVDPDDHHLFVGLGCAAENLALAAGACGRPGGLRARPEINALIRSKISEPYQGVKVIEFDHLSPDDPLASIRQTTAPSCSRSGTAR